MPFNFQLLWDEFSYLPFKWIGTNCDIKRLEIDKETFPEVYKAVYSSTALKEVKTVIECNNWK